MSEITDRRREAAANHLMFAWAAGGNAGRSLVEAVAEMDAAADAVAQPVAWKVPCDCHGTGVVSCQPFPCEHGGHACECDGRGFRVVWEPCGTCGGTRCSERAEAIGHDEETCDRPCPDCDDGTMRKRVREGNDE